MPRSDFSAAAEVLQVCLAKPGISSSRASGIAGVNYRFLERLLNAKLLDVKPRGRARSLAVSAKGLEFLRHYKICAKLFLPEDTPVESAP